MVYPLDKSESQLGITGWIFCKQTPVVANHIVRYLGKLDYAHQIELLDYILSNIDEFSNKQTGL